MSEFPLFEFSPFFFPRFFPFVEIFRQRAPSFYSNSNFLGGNPIFTSRLFFDMIFPPVQFSRQRAPFFYSNFFGFSNREFFRREHIFRQRTPSVYLRSISGKKSNSSTFLTRIFPVAQFFLQLASVLLFSHDDDDTRPLQSQNVIIIIFCPP